MQTRQNCRISRISRISPCRIPALVFALLALTGTARAELDTLLLANFDDKVVKQPIGTGGAAVGEPIILWNSLGIVRPADATFPTPYLSLKDTVQSGTTNNAGYDFEFLNDESVNANSGDTLIFDFDFVFSDDDTTYLSIMPAISVGWTRYLMIMSVPQANTVWLYDRFGGLLWAQGYTPGVPIHFEVVFQMSDLSFDVYLDGNHVVLGASTGGLNVGRFRLDQRVGDADTLGYPLLDNLVVTVLRNQTTVDVADGRPVLAPELLASPNPSRGAVQFEWAAGSGALAPVAATQSLTIYDIRGRLVRTVLHGAPGRSSAQWDGRNESGARVAPGVYFSRFESGGRAATKRISIVR
ncbi:MAG: hypothetical protein HKN20_15815 [Gemmatimonadetes bacterium]|nr:hypothetical protein [Gemmatimonadota bacterium]